LSVHPTAIVAAEARISPTAEIGPYCVVTGQVEIGAHTVIESHVRIGSRYGQVVIGSHNYIQSGASLGGPPQDWGYEDDSTRLVIGDGNRIGEGATINLGSPKGGGVTRVGNRTFIMTFAHVAHDCQVADDVVLTNSTQLAGHVVVEQNAVCGGVVIVTQFVRLGAFCFITLGSLINKDILPYTIAEGRWATPRAVNKVGLKRAGFSVDDCRNIERAVGILLQRSFTVNEALDRITKECPADPQTEHLVDFVRSSERGIARR